MDVPCDFVKNGDERIDRHKTHTRFNKAASEQAAVTKPCHAVTVANCLRFLFEIECLARFVASHEAIGGGKIRVHQLSIGTGFETLDGTVHDLAQSATAFEAGFANF